MESEAQERITVVIDRTKWARLTSADADGNAELLDGSVMKTIGDEGTPCLLNATGTMCCLGFVSKTLLQDVCPAEQSDMLLLHIGTPRGVLSQALQLQTQTLPNACAVDPVTVRTSLGPLLDVTPVTGDTEGQLQPPWDCTNSSLANLAMCLNDLVGVTGSQALEVVKTREQKLVEAFAVHGIDLVFEGKDVTDDVERKNHGEDRSE